jgi:transposase
LDTDTIAELLGGWEGYSIGTVGRRMADDKPQVWIELLPVRDHPRVCSGCGGSCRSVHEVEERWVKDLPILDCSTHLLVHRVRVNCPACGPKLERLSWLEPYARVTVLLAASVARLCRFASVKHAADFYGLNWKTAKAIDKAWLQKELGPVDLSGVEVIADGLPAEGRPEAAVGLPPPRLCPSVLERVVQQGHPQQDRTAEDLRPAAERLLLRA